MFMRRLDWRELYQYYVVSIAYSYHFKNPTQTHNWHNYTHTNRTYCT